MVDAYFSEPIFSHSFLDYPTQDDCIDVFFVGCLHKCKDCCNPLLAEISKDTLKLDFQDFIIRLEDYSKRLNNIKNISLLGGDPLYDKNIDFVNYFLEKFSKDYNICVYTGYNIDFVKKCLNKGFKFIKCGVYDASLKQVSEKTDNYFRLASSNQSIYDENYNRISNNGTLFFRRDK